MPTPMLPNTVIVMGAGCFMAQIRAVLIKGPVQGVARIVVMIPLENAPTRPSREAIC